MIGARIISLLIGYVFGLFETGYIYGKIKNIDIRKHGSGNAGSTNALRTFGVKGGMITLFGDLLKCIIAIIIVYFIFRNQYPDGIRLLKAYTGLGAVLGHNYPFYMKFKGGKGIACTSGLVLSFDIRIIPILAIFFFSVVGITRYVSLGSIIILTGFFLLTVIFGNCGAFTDLNPHYLYELYAIIAIMMIIGLFRHKENIKRLLTKSERKISFHKAGKNVEVIEPEETKENK